MNKQKLHDLRVFAAEIRLETLKIIGSRGFGHVGGSMSMADAMAVLYGDVNLDSRIDITDAVLLNRAVSDTVKLNEQAALNADCDANGELSGNDAVVLLKFLVHIETTLPVSETA